MLIEFLRDVKGCVINGRLSGENDNFTSVSVKGKAVVDYIIVPHEGLKDCVTFHVFTPNELIERVGNDGFSLLGDKCKLPDHSLLRLKFQVRPYLVKESHSQHPSSANALPRRLPESFLASREYNSILLDLTGQVGGVMLSQNDLDAWFDKLWSCIYTALQNSKQKGSNSGFRKSYKPYWNRDLQSLWDRVKLAEREFLKCKNKNLKKGLRIEYKKIQKEFDKSIRTVKRNFNRGLSLQIDYLQTHNPQQFWREINKLGPRKSNEIPMEVRLENGECSSELEVVLKKWGEDFANLYSGCSSSFDEAFLKEIVELKGVMETQMNSDLINRNFFLNTTLSREEVQNAIDRCKMKKATGIDEISNEVLKSPRLLNVLFQLFKSCFDNGIIPTQWNKSIIKPIPKSSKNDPKLPLSYRGISLLSCIYKLYSSILNSRLVDHLERTGFLVDEQNGFRKGRACIDHIYVVSTITRTRIKQNKSTFACFIDFTKAFDWINRDFLQYRLLKSGVNGKFYNAIKSLYQAPSACVQLNEYRTGWFSQQFGVKQGDILSPTLFAIYVNDLALQIKASGLGITVDDQNVGILLYADDIVLLAEHESDLQLMLNIAAEWCWKWRLEANQGKTQIVHFRPKSLQRSSVEFNFGQIMLSYTENYKYLGLTLDEHMTFDDAVGSLAQSAGRALGSVMNKVKHCGHLGFKTFTQLYESGVCPVSDYASGVWGFRDYASCNTVHHRAIRSFLGVHKLTPVLAINGDMGWEPPNIRHKCQMIRLWNRLVKMSDQRLTKHIFNWDFRVGNSWTTELRTLFYSNGLFFIFQNKLQCNIHEIRKTMFSSYKEKWSSDIWYKPKLRSYCLIKDSYMAEPYVKYNLSKRQRSLCAQIRSGTLPLALETGRFNATPEEERYCMFCELGEIENEVHFLFYCPKYTDIREVFVNKMSSICGDFIELDDYEKIEICFAKGAFIVADFICQAWETRQNTLYGSL